MKLFDMQRDKYALIILSLVYVLFGVAITLMQERILYQPSAQEFSRCASEKLELVSYGHTRAYIFGSGSRYAVLYHGNAGSACDRIHIGQLLEQYGYTTLLVEYTGYANDTIRPSHEALHRNVDETIIYLAQHEIHPELIVGESIGTGPAAYHESISPTPSLILITPFNSIKALAHARYWFYPTSYLVINGFDNELLLKKYRGAVLILHGDNDMVIPSGLAQELFESLPSQTKTMHVVQGGGHNTLFEFQDTYDALRVFLNTQ